MTKKLQIFHQKIIYKQNTEHDNHFMMTYEFKKSANLVIWEKDLITVK
jgi:hypothetical protein